MALLRDILAPAILSALTANPAPLLAAGAGKTAEAVTGSPTIGKVASIATGDPSNIASNVVKEAALTGAEQTGSIGKLASAGVRAGGALDTSQQPAVTPSGSSAFNKALPIAALAVPALASLAKTGKITPGLKAGTSLLQGFNAVQNIEEQSAKNREIEAKEKFLNTKSNYKLKPGYLKFSPETRALIDERYATHVDENGLSTNRVQGMIRQQTLDDATQLDTILKSESSIRDSDAAKAFEKAEKIRIETGEDSVEYQKAIRDYKSKSRVAQAFASSGDELRQAAADKAKLEKGGAEKAGVNIMLPDRSIVLSFDGGRTYTDASGTSNKVPAGSVKVPGGATLSELNIQAAKGQAADVPTVPTVGPTPEEAARGGTGPFANIKAVIDNVAGGLGLDKIFGKEGFFPDTQENRQQLRLIKQTGKSALLNSARGAIWEQEKIDQLFADPDKIWTNPSTEAKKFELLRNTLITERSFNNQAITSSTNTKEIEKLRNSNLELNRLLELLGEGEGEVAAPQDVQPTSGSKFDKFKR